MQITEVKTKKDETDFLLLPTILYQNDPNWIRALDKDIKEVFDKHKNKFFRHGECIRWLLKDDDDKVIGRVAAFINTRTASKNDQPTGGMGFFECIENKEAAFLLFDTCKLWLQQRNMQAMDGPVNFGERESWWGLIVEGFDPPPYKMNYNLSYYKYFFEEYGFKTYFEQWCYSLNPLATLEDKFYKRHQAIKQNSDYTTERIRKKEIEKYAEDFKIIYNKAWAKHGGGKDLESKQVQVFFKKMKPVIDEKIIWFVYHKNEPVAFFINLPDINRIFKLFNGKFGWFEKLKFVFYLKKRISRKVIGLVFGIVPEHQGKGIDSFMIVEQANLIQKENLYNDYEMQWIGDFNPKMVAIAEDLGTKRSRVLVTYRYLFDRSKEFKRHPFFK